MTHDRYVSTVTQKMTDSDWVTVKLPKELVAEIDCVRKRQSHGYTSRAEVVKEAVRSYLAELKNK